MTIGLQENDGQMAVMPGERNGGVVPGAAVKHGGIQENGVKFPLFEHVERVPVTIGVVNLKRLIAQRLARLQGHIQIAGNNQDLFRGYSRFCHRRITSACSGAHGGEQDHPPAIVGRLSPGAIRFPVAR